MWWQWSAVPLALAAAVCSAQIPVQSCFLLLSLLKLTGEVDSRNEERVEMREAEAARGKMQPNTPAKTGKVRGHPRDQVPLKPRAGQVRGLRAKGGGGQAGKQVRHRRAARRRTGHGSAASRPAIGSCRRRLGRCLLRSLLFELHSILQRQVVRRRRAAMGRRQRTRETQGAIPTACTAQMPYHTCSATARQCSTQRSFAQPRQRSRRQEAHLHHALHRRLHVGIQPAHQGGKARRVAVLDAMQRLCVTGARPRALPSMSTHPRPGER